MFFEGSEKKTEIILRPGHKTLLELEKAFWANLVHKCEAEILSDIKNGQLWAFLLSESSLFVWEDRITLITCGQTKLINALEFFIQEIGKENIDQVIFQRKNEYYSHLQATSFFDDIKQLDKLVAGKSYRVGNMDGHHNFLFHSNETDFMAQAIDQTYEILIYDINKKASEILTTQNQDKKVIRNFLKLDHIIPGFEVDDYVFTPYGYSLNAIQKDKYLTIHITPQENGSYVSFEGNFPLLKHIKTIINTFNPQSFDLIAFNDQKASESINQLESDYFTLTKVEDKLENGYHLNFYHSLKKGIKELKLHPLETR